MALYPLFPLEIVVFPLEELNLHIFEPRYRQLIHDCADENILFGIPYFRRTQEMKYGSLVKLVSIEKKYPNGRMDIRTQGVSAFEINHYLEIYPDKKYPGGYLTKLNLDLELDILACSKIFEQLLELYQFMDIKSVPKALNNESFYTFEIAHKVGLNQDQEYHLLQIPTERERQEYIISHLEALIPIARNMEEIRKKIERNGHFKDILPPEG